MKNIKKSLQINIITLIISFTLLLKIINLIIDYILGDGDGQIVTLNFSKHLESFSIIVIFISIIWIIYYFKKRIPYLLYLVTSLIVIDLIIPHKIYKNKYLGIGLNEYYQPDPYIGFKGKPDLLMSQNKTTNGMGFRGDEGFNADSFDSAQESKYIIAFFGGSTGFLGSPSIAGALKEKLVDKGFKNGNIFVSNFSVISSNHNQHLHMIVKYLINKNVDLVIFYGGYNETIQTAYYDPRPGYPYNYFYTYNTSHIKKMIIENSFIISTLFNNIGIHKILLEQNKLELGEIVFSENWNKKIIDNYFNTLHKANILIKSSGGSFNKKAKFLAIYQPYQVPDEFQQAHGKIKSKIENTDYIYDLSGNYDNIKNPYTDIVHVTQEARDHMAQSISNIILNEYR